MKRLTNVSPSPLSDSNTAKIFLNQDRSSLSSRGRLAGIDYGTVRIGVALSDTERQLATAHDNYTRRSPQLDADYFTRLAREEQLAAFVVGLPIHLDGRESQKSVEARAFGHWLETTTGVPVIYFDERFTSAEAEQLLQHAQLSKKKRKARLDKLAAQIMLTAFLEAGNSWPGPLQGLED